MTRLPRLATAFFLATAFAPFDALVSNYNVAVRAVGSRAARVLSTDGSEGNYYDPASLVWSPDSSKLAAYKVTPGHRRFVHFVESSPEDQLQPKNSNVQYAKPGDVPDVERPFIFNASFVHKDAGFPDRIRWHKAVAAKYPYYDISRVGLYGTSAGGQNSLGGLLFFPEFYKAAVSSAGCHDNRMDKIWWNEQWMGWPLGEHYAESSNATTRIGSRATCSSSSARWTPTSIRLRRCRS